MPAKDIAEKIFGKNRDEEEDKDKECPL